MKIKDKNGTIFVSVLLIFLIIEIAYFSFRKENTDNFIEDKKVSKKIENNNDTKENLENKNEFIAYNNNKFKYEITFSENWFLNTDNSENSLEKDLESNLSTGGQTFWSNYSNMNDFSPSDHPDDFHMLALVVYENENIKDIDDLAKKLEFDEDSIQKEFQANNITGKKFIAPSLIEGNPRVAIIFQKEDLFYVFRLAFINGDVDIAEQMENIVRSFKLV